MSKKEEVILFKIDPEIKKKIQIKVLNKKITLKQYFLNLINNDLNKKE